MHNIIVCASNWFCFLHVHSLVSPPMSSLLLLTQDSWRAGGGRLPGSGTSSLFGGSVDPCQAEDPQLPETHWRRWVWPWRVVEQHCYRLGNMKGKKKDKNNTEWRSPVWAGDAVHHLAMMASPGEQGWRGVGGRCGVSMCEWNGSCKGKWRTGAQRAAQGHQLSPSHPWRKRLKITWSSFFSPCRPSRPFLAAGGREGEGEKRRCQIVGS